jgi:hypothetical protein
MDFNGILIGFLTLCVILLPIALKKGLETMRHEMQNLDELVCQQILKIWRVLDKIRGPVSHLLPVASVVFK